MAIDGRLQRLLGGEVLAALRARLRQRFEPVAPAIQVESFRMAGLSPDEHAALAALMGRPQRFAASIRVDVCLIDSVLQRADVAASLRAALASLVQTAGGIGLLKRLAGQNQAAAARSLAGADAVLQQLPAHGVTRAQLAANVLGDAHALDPGCAVATLVLAVLRCAQLHQVPLDAQAADPEGLSQRDLWASAGVLVNELARPALVLNLPGAAVPGEPAYFSLRALVRSPLQWAVQGRMVFVCENPNLVAIAADHLGRHCAPLVCTDGMPAAAQRTLLTQLRQGGATLRYHGDFDWPGITIGNHMMAQHGTSPWRFGTADYEVALRRAPLPGRALHTDAVEALWDAALAAAMRTALRAIDEEMVAELLLQDLAQRSPPHA